MVAADLGRREGFGVAHVGVAHDGQVLAERFERAQARRAQIEIAANTRRRPEVLLDPERRAARRSVHHLDRNKANLSVRSRGAEDRSRRNHRLEQRERQGRAHTLEHGAARQMFVRDVHQRLLRSRSKLSITEDAEDRRNIPLASAREPYPNLCVHRVLDGGELPDHRGTASVVTCFISGFAILNAALLTTPRMNDDSR